MTPRRRELAVALMIALPCACGRTDIGVTDVDQREAQVSWNAANNAVGTAFASFATRVAIGEEGDITVLCRRGGSLELAGRRNDEHDFRLDVIFDDCRDGGVVMSGDLTVVSAVELDADVEFDAHADHHDGVSASVLVEYEGEMAVDGDAHGVCLIDARIRARAISVEDFGAASQVIEGGVCGHDAADVIHG